MSDARTASRGFRWTWLRRSVQVGALVLFALPLIATGWGLFGLFAGGEEAVPAPAQLPFFGSLSSSSIFGIEVLDPFAMLQTIAASKTFALDWLLAALPVLVLYGLIRGRAFWCSSWSTPCAASSASKCTRRPCPGARSCG